MKARLRELWQCPKCGERFTSRNLWHACGQYDLKALFAHAEPHVFRLYTRFVELVQECGPIHIIPQKTRNCFQVRVRFAGCVPRKSYLLASFWLMRRHSHPKVTKIESYGTRWYFHHVRIDSEQDFDPEFKKWIREAYAVGQQKHLAR